MKLVLFLYMAQILPKCRKKLIPIVFDKWRKIIFIIFDIINGIPSKLPVIWLFSSHLIRNSSEQTISITINIPISVFNSNYTARLHPNQAQRDHGRERSLEKPTKTPSANPRWSILTLIDIRRISGAWARPCYWKTHPIVHLKIFRHAIDRLTGKIIQKSI